jgi:hypothetical protein
MIATISEIVAGLVAAHPGHGVNGGSYSLVHYLAQPEHALGVVLGMLAVAYLLGVVRQR